ncbi:MAG: PDZ domain-containing protein [Clostridia bacterium]|nr:PDZ domain-containing protein [Clostridia bacterium]
MNKKISLGIVIGLVILAIAASSAISIGIMAGEYNKILEGLPEKLDRYEILDELDDIINKNYYGKSVEENLEQAIAQGYVEGLGDGSSKYMTAQKYADYLSENGGNMLGVGIEYIKNSSGYIEITEVYPSSPAESAGLKKGDVIIAFDGIMIDAENYEEMEEKLIGDKLTSVNIIYKRGDTETSVSVVKGYEASSVDTSVYENVGYIEITDFYPGTAEQVKNATDKFTSSGLTTIIIDLRNNGSDNYDTAMETLDIFVPMSDSERPAASVVDENGNVVKTYATTSGEVNARIGVLLSKKTKQAAELFACNIRDFGKGQLFAVSTTGGSSLVQEIFELSSGSAVLLTTGKILPYVSESFEGKGLTPDYVLEASATAEKIEEDMQFLYAVSMLSATEIQ